jgi:hypothetical protein
MQAFKNWAQKAPGGLESGEDMLAFVGVEADVAVYVSEPLFAPYEATVDSFLHAGDTPHVLSAPRPAC